MTTIFISGSGMFGATVADRLTDDGHTVVGIASPDEGRRGTADVLTTWAARHRVHRVSRDVLKPADVPERTDLIIAAHSHAFIGTRTRARAAQAVGYHPSLLPLHRGRDAVKWQARLGERVVGGSIYHLTNRVDGGPLAAQRHLIVEPGLTASQLWRTHLFPLGVEMIAAVAADAAHGDLPRRPQNDDLATWEPSFDSKPLYRPELLEIEP